MEALIPVKEEKGAEKVAPGSVVARAPAGTVAELGIQEISPNPYQPRKKFDEGKLEELVASLRKKGIIQPVVVRSVEGGYELIAGERRLQAAKKLGMSHIPAIVKSATDREMLEMSLVENLQRDDLNPLEEAMSCQQLIQEFGLTQEKVAEELGKNRASVANTLRLLKLPSEVKEELLRDRISRGHAIALLGLDNATEQMRLCRRIIRQKLSVRETEALAKRTLTPGHVRKHMTRTSPEIVALEEKLQRFLGTRVTLKKHKAGGRIEVHFYSDEDLDRILDLLCVRPD